MNDAHCAGANRLQNKQTTHLLQEKAVPNTSNQNASETPEGRSATFRIWSRNRYTLSTTSPRRSDKYLWKNLNLYQTGQPLRVVSRCSTRSRTSIFTVHLSSSSDKTQFRTPPRTALDVLTRTHLVWAGPWPTSLTYSVVNLAARKSRPGSLHTLEIYQHRDGVKLHAELQDTCTKEETMLQSTSYSKTALRNTTVTSPRLTQTSSKLEA